MTRTLHRAPTLVLAFLLATLAAVAIAAARPAPAPAGGDENLAVAINTRDGSSLFRFAFSIRRVTGEVVDQTNAAVAYASCVDCQTVALALQVVLVFSEAPNVITPTNLAIAINDDCASCATAALAYQYVIGGRGPVRFTADGNRGIAEIRRQFRRLRKSGLSLMEILAETEKLNAELRDILASELVPAGRDDDGDDRGRRHDGDAERQRPPERSEDAPPTEPPPQEPPPTEPPPTEPAPTEPGTGSSP